MELPEAKEKFIQSWGTLGTNWGINRTMAQIHALLLISPQALSADDIISQLQISRGNVNMNVRSLIDWGLVYREYKTGERKEFFYAEKDMWRVFKQIVKERRKRELEPVFKVMEDVKNINGDPNDPEQKAFLETLANIQNLSTKADRMLETVMKSDESWFLSTIMKLLK
jgi:DNA-binding transcriptional regulator GbsR (MarR family)